MYRLAHAALFVVVFPAGVLLAAASSAVLLGFTHAAVMVAGITAAALAIRRAARLLQLPMI